MRGLTGAFPTGRLATHRRTVLHPVAPSRPTTPRRASRPSAAPEKLILAPTRSLGTSLDDLGTRPTIVAIGNFDGVHLGHRAVLAGTAEDARARGCTPVALTFEPHPTAAVGRPAPACLTTIERKLELIARIDPELRVVVQHFDATFAAMTPEQFARQVLVDRCSAQSVRVGANFRFGARRSGDLAALQALGITFGFEAQVAPLLGDVAGRYSSTRARECVSRGDLKGLRHILGRPHAVSGQVVEGQQRARTLGFPTANLSWVAEALPPHGVYAVAVDLVDSNTQPSRLGAGVCNIGVRPTVEAGFAVEVHLFDHSENLYGKTLRVHLLDSLRAERKFANLEALRAQIVEDSQRAKDALQGLAPAADAGKAWF